MKRIRICRGWAVGLLLSVAWCAELTAAPYTWVAGSGGNWQDDANWSPAGPNYSSDTFSLDTGGDLASAANGQTFAAQLTLNADTTLRVPDNANVSANNLVLNGGTLFGDIATNKGSSINGVIHLQSNSRVRKDAVNNGTRFDIAASINSSAGTTFELDTPLDAGVVNVTSDNSGSYAGDWLLTEGRLRVTGSNGLGSGTATVTQGAVLELANVMDVAGVRVDVEQGGQLTLLENTTSGIANAHLATGAALRLGIRTNSTNTSSGTFFIDGDITMTAGDSVNGTPHTFNGSLNGNGNIEVDLNGGNGTIALNSDNSGTFSGDWLLTQGRLRVSQANALGTGTATVTNGATLQLGDVVDAAGSRIDVQQGGQLVLMSSNSSGAANVHLEEGATLIAGLATNKGSSSTGNFYVDGDITMTGGSASNASRHDFAGMLFGSGDIEVNYNNGGKGNGYIDMEADNSSTFSGDWSLLMGDLGISDEGALGTGGLTIDGGFLRFVTSNMSITVDTLVLGDLQIEAGVYDVDTEITDFDDFFIGNTGGSTSITVLNSAPTQAAVPEPSTILLMLIVGVVAAAGHSLVRRKTQHRRQQRV